MAAWDEGRRIVERAKLFSGGGFVLLLLLAVYAGLIADFFNACYFGVLSGACLALHVYVRRTFRAKGTSRYSLRSSTQRR